jgi:hypothetical protein
MSIASTNTRASSSSNSSREQCRQLEHTHASATPAAISSYNYYTIHSYTQPYTSTHY